ncbi:baseplate J/gp47 family protein [Pontibacter russatus]|uniref:hypothetical protein n=1 Tax=Pontibacter russatus TaxID=2694929 RepID=UPI0013794A8E|nr:hypothetical protein [Pontibacter russatus]
MIEDCKELTHPFQNDPGVSQRQRMMDDLLSGPAQVDGRTLADLLDYFAQLSRHVNFYDSDLSVSDWQPFFQKSIPFSLAAISKYKQDTVTEKLAAYRRLFQKAPAPAGLQLLVHYVFHRLLNSINTWHQQVQGSGLPVTFALENLIKDKLRYPAKAFITYANAAVKWYCIKPLNWQPLAANEVWGLDVADLYTSDASFRSRGNTSREKITALYQLVYELVPAFLDVIRVVAGAAALSIEQSLLPLKEELRQNHPPHLALLFSFLKLFRYLQDDLNTFTKKHLDFFYKQVLQLKPQEATPDKAFLIFDIQKQLNNYLLQKGLLVKDGKDNNKAELFFALDDEIVVNKTQVAEKLTLFLHNQTAYKTTYLEGVYMAPDAGKADGLEKDFDDAGTSSFATLGAKDSKYVDPESKYIKPHPNARLGFILASPVLLLNEGKRTITITLACELNQNICADLSMSEDASSSCCEDELVISAAPAEAENNYPAFAPAQDFYEKVATTFNTRYYYISQELISKAKKKGIGAALTDRLLQLISFKRKLCYCETEELGYERIIPATGTTEDPGFEDIFSEAERVMLADFFKPRRALHVLFSGEKEWLEPSSLSKITLSPAALPLSHQFKITIEAVLEPDKPAVTFYDKDKLKEDFNTALPLVKIELDDKIKLWQEISSQPATCCLEKELQEENLPVSLYHFFRNVTVKDSDLHQTSIAVQVCEFKNIVVQNDESLQDVNAPIYPFGTRPSIPDFDVVNPVDPPLANPNLIGPSFYIGSNEVFCKKWGAIRININWKDKPSDFRDYYKAYVIEDVAAQVFGLDQNEFKIRLSVLQNKNWSAEAADRKLFDMTPPAPLPPLFPGGPVLCEYGDKYEQSIVLDATAFPAQDFCISPNQGNALDVQTRNGFLKMNLRNQDFLHKDYAFVLARQMMALGRYPDAILEGAVYKKEGDTVLVFRSLGKTIVELKDDIFSTKDSADLLKSKIDDLNTTFDAAIDFPPPLSTINNAERDSLIPLVHDSKSLSDDTRQQAADTKDKLSDLQSVLDIFDIFTGEIVKPLTVLIPNEPWTPVIREISIDYTATATITDIELIHLYPFAGTFMPEELELQPTLLPTFCDEGTLLLGLRHLVPGSNVNILFQMAEATADSESGREEVGWAYLDNNQWKALRPGFEVLEDGTNDLTTSGIVKLALPANITSDNTILPKGLHWIKAAAPKNSRSVSETIGIHTQAIQVTFAKEAANDPLRLEQALPAGSIAKLKEADVAIKKVEQPYNSFGGRVPEAEGHFYVRVSELLRHKGRAIQKFDYERLALEAFPQLYKVKCINHSFALDAHIYFNDFPVAPGYVLLAVIPDLNRIKAAQSFEPRVPVSLLESIEAYLRQRTSPFVRLRVMNPRYERVHFCLKVKLYQGRDQNFYKEKLKQDVREFLAPWAIGQYDKLTFGQCLYNSDIIRFLETRDYLDYVLELLYWHESEPQPGKSAAECVAPLLQPVCPRTPRSILIAGDIDVCIQQKDCDEWQQREPCDHTKVLLADYCKK